jgi:hypothetical protein
MSEYFRRNVGVDSEDLRIYNGNIVVLPTVYKIHLVTHI